MTTVATSAAAATAYQARIATDQARRAQADWHQRRIDEEQRHQAAGRTLLGAANDHPSARGLAAAAAEREAAQTPAEQAAGGRVYRVPTDNLNELQTAVAQLARRATKLDLDPITLTDTGSEIVARDENGVTVGHEYRYVVIAGPRPQLAGWAFVAVLEHDHEADQPRAIIRRVPQGAWGEIPDTDLAAYRATDARCEHCGTLRRRNDTYLVQKTDGAREIKQVGSSCLRDFTGHPSPDAIARLAERIADLADLAEDAERDEPTSSGPALYPVDLYLAYVAQAIRRDGWTPRSRATGYGDATADQALDALRDTIRGATSEAPTTADTDTATNALAWVRDTLAHQDADLSDFEHNLIVALDGDYLTDRRTGIAAAAINTYRRGRERQAAAAADPGHLGAIDDRIDVTVTVISVRYRETEYGTTSIYKLRADSCHQLVWFASRDVLTEGASYTLRGTVKRHDEWDGQSETHLTRCKILDPDPEPCWPSANATAGTAASEQRPRRGQPAPPQPAPGGRPPQISVTVPLSSALKTSAG